MTGEPNNQPISVRTVKIDAAEAGRRLDNFLVSLLGNVPKSFIYRIIRSGEVRVNGSRCKAHRRLCEDDQVRIPPFRPPNTKDPLISKSWLQRIEHSICYEDDELIVVDKPSGLAVHAGSGLSFGLIDIMRRLRGDRVELGHRLDRETSGCLVLAKSMSSTRRLHDIFRAGNIEKRYMALLRDCLPQSRLEVSAPIKTSRKEGGEARSIVAQDGKPAHSEFIVTEMFAGMSAVEVAIRTGRTHQIRVHAKHLGHPVAGDARYGDDAFNELLSTHGLHRLFLHAKSLVFEHPQTAETVSVVTNLPSALSEVLANIRKECTNC